MPSSASTSLPVKTNAPAFDSPGSTQPETILIKLGGSLDEEIRQTCADVHALWSQGHRVVIVHGGSVAANQLSRELGRPAQYLTSADGQQRARYTDPASLDTLTLAMLGRVKPRLVAELARLGVPAVGICGIDGSLLSATRTPPVRARVTDAESRAADSGSRAADSGSRAADSGSRAADSGSRAADGDLRVVRDDMTGRVTAIDPRLLLLLLDGGYVPVLSPPVLSTAGEPLSTDADRLAAAIAGTLGAAWLIVLSNVPGLLRDPSDEDTVITRVPVAEIDDYMSLASGRMRVKLRATAEAAKAGVSHVVLADGRREGPVLAARAGAGTAITTESAS
jgi:[amino group carrier protein]-L-2-aminoadipate/L-glutamate 6-kinase